MEETGTKEVVLVDENDRVLGTMEKLKAHQDGLLHRAFSVVIFNDKNEMLIHKRASDKYHCGGLWTNTCCSHPRLEETVKEGALRRMNEEMGFTTSIHYIGQFIYKTAFENGLTEHELDHLFVGRFNGEPKPNPEEVEDFRYVTIDELKADIEKHPENYTVWFKEIVDKYLTELLAYG
ncbi:isopentenyl-diphosphate Delta-isomerase [Brumimicrobium aurantiacum]|uniref:Isopentenyl-diphosphate delta-isomerase n=1 Tax=Brumimicrobium aurantiacum TaxID=1737063 RepID=A0A3E1F1N7_9FLAO|nr:isopentenyl-diphosphate Delta-isomerase [Brumimicrobium aurantiacum]RFC55725.1 isopentenyl-diphosphate Delta-isomerase [Brumimicrobium aurantiacum]